MTILGTRWLREFRDGAIDLLFPPSCVACHVELQEAADQVALCHDCRSQLSLTAWPVCRRCGARVPKIPGAVDDCVRCRAPTIRFDQTFALGSYDGLLRDLVLQMKRDRSERFAHMFAHLIALQRRDHLETLQIDAIAAVPMHPWRRLTRGTNAAAALADGLGRRLGLEVCAGLLRRRRNTRSQLGLTPAGRFRNVRGEMRVAAGYHLDAPHVLLVDDVLTTGATCSEAARMLKRAGAARVTVVVVARTPIH